MKRSTRWLLGLMLAVLPVLAAAANQPIEASMVLTGTITVNPDGSVKTYTLHEEDKVPPGVVQLVKRTIQGWQFVPIVEGGKAVTAKAGMAVRVAAEMADVHAKQMTVRVAGAQFGCNAYQAKSLLPNACQPDTTVQPTQRKPPLYPLDALRAGAEGTAYLMVEVGRDGHVIRAATSQVNLFHRTRRDPRMRDALAKAAEAAAMNWEYKVPTVGTEAAKDHWVVQIPVRYTIMGNNYDRGYGRWSAYLPGPVQNIPWSDEDAAGGSRGSADAISGSAPFTRDIRFVLKTPLGAEGDRS